MPHVIPLLLANGCGRSAIVEGVEDALAALETVTVLWAIDELGQES